MTFLIFKGQCKDQWQLFKIQTIVKSHHKLQELLPFLIIFRLQLLHWILALDIGQCLAKNRAMSDKSCFITDAFVRRKVKQTNVLKLRETFGKYRPFVLVFLFMNMLIDSLFMQLFYIQNRQMYLSEKILYHYFVVFCPAWDSFPSESILYVIR